MSRPKPTSPAPADNQHSLVSHRVTLRLPSLSGSDGIPYRSVSEWLESIRMKRYILHFRSAGLDTMECVLELTAEYGPGAGVSEMIGGLGSEPPDSKPPFLSTGT